MADEPITTMKNPPHPGHFVRAITAELSLSVTAAAGVLGMTRAAVSAVLNERAALSSDMALRIEKAFGVKMDTLMGMQNAYDIALARSREGEIKVEPFVRPKETPKARLQKTA